MAIIPARGGSKGIPQKNLRILGNKPLIAYPIIEASKSQMITEIVVSTDDLDIQAYVNSLGIKTILRPKNLAEDTSPVIDSVFHVLTELERDLQLFDLVVLLQPTSPFWRSSQLDEMIHLFSDPNVDGVVSVVPSVEAHPSRMYSLGFSNFLIPITENGETQRRQDLEPVYFRNGCFYAVRTSVLNSQKTLMPKRKKAYLMDSEWFMTIDSPRDLKLAQVMAEDWNLIGNS